MLAKELISQVRKIEIRTRKAVEEITGGAYHSVFKGRGIEFDEVREYSPGDDVRDIDWNVTARMGAPFVKKYVEERELTVILAVDVSESGAFGSTGKTKRRSSIETAALLAFSAIRNNDKVGLLLFSDETELFIAPRSGRKHGLRLIRELVATEPRRAGTSIGRALEFLVKTLTKKSVVFLVSDFIDDGYDKILKIANKRHDVVAVRVLDQTELEWPVRAAVTIEDSETGESVFFPGTSAALGTHALFADAARARAVEACDKAKVDMIDLRCGGDLLAPLVKFFRKRQSRFR